MTRATQQPRGVTLLGSTGSIGLSTLDVIARHPQRYRVVALTANTQGERLFEQCLQYRPEMAVLLDPAAAEELRAKLRAVGLTTQVLSGLEGLTTVATLPEAAIVVAAIVGAAGLLPTLAAVRAGKRVLFANKEPLVMCGHLFIEEARRSGAELLPVDSEHNAIFQCMADGFRAGRAPAAVRRIYLTCSGGPFRSTPVEALARVTPEQACAHPNWVMGRKISVDSATLMNKGLELIEACWLFGVTPDRVEIVIHPQSIIHSLVEYVDGSVLAQLGNPDMRTPIAHALAWPERIESGVKSLDLLEIARLEFAPPDRRRFPCLDLAYEAAAASGTAPAILNAANEVAVQAFLDRRIGFTDIPQVIARVRARLPAGRDVQLDAILADDAAARAEAARAIAVLERPVQQGVR
ncbi:MAG: 1-deoxy-D-xylulose-5-phosphate reductoisomerase [Candidatus Muproteobacteria bacterium RBG_16_65_34]|uniref:1-deoxy-D-xylulose 5-phosphate reductoisomerase n=1 Tax=Candidatus Muproteobacteria bacterium RBG_16_65_34 TaxID=1817760 RepID=A0A1F6TMX8_9PROT|nr:MAG: 1-deoxy-D-xylulose-5-phosphate reductoisomerase [Candidatus Muproteobacteria bacterium RBG_16_65_34]